MGVRLLQLLNRWEDILSAKMLRINVLLAIGSLVSATPSHIGAGIGLGAGLGVGGGVGLVGGVNNGAYATGGYAYGIHDTQCQTFYDTKIDTACHTEHDQACHTEQDQVCHTEFDTVVDTTYVEDCQDIVTEQC